jgi:hypothetical protein
MEKDFGSDREGKIANLLLLDANPLASVEAWSRIDKVILHGEPIDRETLAGALISATWVTGTAAPRLELLLLRAGVRRSDLRPVPWSKASTLWGACA